ncbi:hypothetical protein NC651_032251 [Populus alba x Populus x berolinensis]|nr:hypothetical protein NC651_032251 [Populus alba x Populus x berolinensis]
MHDQNPSRIKALNVINEDIKDEDSVILNLELINVFRRITNADACSFVCQIVSDYKFVLVYFEPDVEGHDLLIKSLISNHHFDGKLMWGRNNPGCSDEMGGCYERWWLRVARELGGGEESCGCMCIELENMSTQSNKQHP